MAMVRPTRAADRALRERRRAVLAGVIAGVALVVVAVAVLLWIRAPGAPIDKALARDVAADAKDELPAPATVPAAPAPVREEAPPTRMPAAMRFDAPEPVAKATLAVRVVQAATGEPCPKYWISTDVDRSLPLANVPAGAYAMAAGAGRYTDADGRADLVFPARVAMVVTVASPLHGVANLEQKIEALEVDERRFVTIPMALPAAARACVRCVAAATHAPISGATLTLGSDPIGTSDRDGRLVIVIDREHADPILARAAGFTTGVAAWEAVRLSTEAEPFDLALEPGATLEVILSDERGAVVSGVPIRVDPDSHRFNGRSGEPWRPPWRRDEAERFRMGSTDGNGRVRIENLPAGVALEVIAGNESSREVRSRWPRLRVVLAAGETRRLDVRERASATVRGRVVGSTAVPTRVVASNEAEVSLGRMDEITDAQRSRLLRQFGLSIATCDERGAFEIAELVPGKLMLAAVAPDGTTLAATYLDLREGERREGIELAVAQKTIHCHVTRDGAPVAGARVTCDDVRALDVREEPALTDDDGRCELRVANVPLQIRVRTSRDAVDRSFLFPPAETIEFELGRDGEARTRTPRIVGRVPSSSAQGGSSAVVTAIRHDAIECRGDTVAVRFATPSFEFRELAAGTWDLTITDAGKVASLSGVSVQAGATANVGDVTLKEGVRLDVTFARDPTSTLQLEQDDATLIVRRGEVRVALVVLARGETARLVVPVGSATLELRRDGQWIDGRDVVLAAEAATAVTLGAR